MRTKLGFTCVLIVISAFILPGAALAGGLDDFIDEIDLRASADFGKFRADLGLAYDVSEDRLDWMFQVMSKPSDVYMCLRIGELSGHPIDFVIDEYKRNRGQGWGVIAKSLGIKPGSAEFHALKAGRLPGHGGHGKANKKDKPGKGRK
jgi:hypothetical protein